MAVSPGTVPSMKNRLTTAILITAALGAAGCSSSSKAAIKTDVRSAVTDVSTAISSAATNLGSDISTAASGVENNAAEALARNIAAQQGEKQFKDAGKELDGSLTCTAKVQDGAAKIAVDCTGTTKTGGKAELKGTTSEMPGTSGTSLKGDFTGTVDGTSVFTTQDLGG